MLEHVAAGVLGVIVADERPVLQIQPHMCAVGDDAGVDGQRPADGRLCAGRGLAGDAVGGGDEVPELDEIIRALMVCLRGSRDGVIRFGCGRFLGGLCALGSSRQPASTQTAAAQDLILAVSIIAATLLSEIRNMIEYKVTN